MCVVKSLPTSVIEWRCCFAAQNFQSVTVYFLTFKMSAPHAVLIVLLYILGMVTGGSVGALMRRAFEGSRSLYDERSRTN